VSLHAAVAGGIAARSQGLRRRYNLLLARGGRLRLTKSAHGEERMLAEGDLPWTHGDRHRLRLEVRGTELVALVDGQERFRVRDEDRPLQSGGVALVIEEGWLSSGPVSVTPL
jgi:hypothetical protein